MAPRPAFGWAMAFPVPGGAAPVTLRYAGQWKRTAELWVLAALWLAALWLTRKPARMRRPPALAPPEPEEESA